MTAVCLARPVDGAYNTGGVSPRDHLAITGRRLLQINTFGRLSVTDDGRPVAGAASQPRRLALLAMLACAGERGLTRDKLIAFFWPDADEERARRGLSQAVYALRQDLGSEEALIGTKDLRINPDLITSDVAQFEAAIAASAWDRAASCYAGPFLDGFHLPNSPEFERWSEEQRTGYARQYTDVLERLARDATGKADHSAAVGWWRKLAAQDPLNARVALGLMKSLVAAGDRNGALQHARVYEALIQQELDLPPDREVVALADQIRREQPAPTVAAPAPAQPTPEAASLSVGPAEAANPSVTPTAPTPDASVPAPLPGSLVKAMSRFLEEQDVSEAQSTADWLDVIKGKPGRDAPSPPPQSSRLWVTGGAIAALLVAGVALVLSLRKPPRELAFGPTHRLAFDAGLEMDPAISPDGKVVAYAADPDGRMRIFVRQVNGGGRAVPITEALAGYHRAPRWSPDGTQIAFQSGGTIYLVPALGGVPRPLIRPTSPSSWTAYPAWSPDGKQIAYVENSVVFVRPLAGGPPTRLAATDYPHSLAWSPDGLWIAFVSGNAAFTFGGQPWGSPTNIGNVAPSSVWLVPSHGGAPIRITDEESLNTSPAWLPGSRALLFVSSRLGSRDAFRIAIDASGKPVGDPVRLTTGLNAQTISFTADGRRGAYSVFTYTANVWAVDIPASGVASLETAQPVTSGSQAVEGIALSPDGRWLGFDSDRNGNQDIYRAPLGGGDIEQLTQSPEPDFLASWSPGGQEIAFYSYRRGTRRALVMPAEGGAATEVAPELVNQRNPGWAPDGNGLVFSADVRDGPSQIYLVRRKPDSTWAPPRRLTTDGGGSGRWSPDGRTIAFTNRRGLWLANIEGDLLRPIVAASDSSGYPVPEVLQWSTDGRTIFYKAFDSEGRSSIWSITASGGQPRLLMRFDDPSRPSSRPEFATDGKRLYFSIGQRQSDVWTVELVAAR